MHHTYLENQIRSKVDYRLKMRFMGFSFELILGISLKVTFNLVLSNIKLTNIYLILIYFFCSNVCAFMHN